MKKISFVVVALLTVATVMMAQTPVAYVSYRDCRLTDKCGLLYAAWFSPEPTVMVGFPTQRQQPQIVVNGFSIVCSKGKLTTEGNHFSEEMKTYFKRLKPAEEVRLVDIRATDENGNAVSVEPIVLYFAKGKMPVPSHPVSELVCNGRFYKDNDTISVADIMADTVYLTTRYNGFGEPVHNCQIIKYAVSVYGMMYECDGAGLRTSIKDILAEKTSDGLMFINDVRLVETAEDGTEKSIRASGGSFYIRVDNK